MKNKLHLSNVSLICVDCANIDRAIKSMETCLYYVYFDSVKLLTSIQTNYQHAVKTHHIGSKIEYTHFMIKELWEYIDTDYCLIVQHDGYILNPDAWDNNWYNYDYIGGNDYWTGSGAEGTGGNGGFSFRSKRLHVVLKDNYQELNQYSSRKKIYSEDMYISRDSANWLKQRGYKFATREIQEKFSAHGRHKLWNGHFGCHGKNVNKTLYTPITYSYCFEDRNILKFIEKLKIKGISYLDIGFSSNPSMNNNTYLFYKNGYQGVVAEPTLYWREEIKKQRPNDKLIEGFVKIRNDEIGIIKRKRSDETKSYLTDIKWRGSPECYEINLFCVNDIIEKNFNGKYPTILTINTKEYALLVLKTIDLEKYLMPVICININHEQEKIISYLKENRYKLEYNNSINGIFIRTENVSKTDSFNDVIITIKDKDIIEHVEILKQYASSVNHITEFGRRNGVSTCALLSGIPKQFRSYDIRKGKNDNIIQKTSIDKNIDCQINQGDTNIIDIEDTDLLFIDTLHTYKQLTNELNRHANKVRKYIMLHDTVTFGNKNEINDGSEKQGLMPAINEFLDKNNGKWKIAEEYKNNNGLLILISN